MTMTIIKSTGIGNSLKIQKQKIQRDERVEQLKQNIKANLALLLAHLSIEEIRSWMKSYLSMKGK